MVAYAARFSSEKDGSAINVSFRDIPGTNTFGRTTEEAVEMAQDALACALSYYAEEGRAFPRPSAPKKGERLIVLPALIQAKLQLWAKMGETGINKADLAEKLNLDHKAVRRLLKLDHNSRIESIEAALLVLGETFTVTRSKASA